MLQYLVISDIHLGNKRTTSKEIADNIKAYFRRYTQLKDISILFIAGDLFDDLVDYSQPDAYYINDVLVEIIHYCQQHQIILRVLEGTPSHDWGQSRVIQTLIQATRHPIDYRYIRDIEIESITAKGTTLSVLYVPDEIRPTATHILSDVKRKMGELELEQVDIAIMHGMFNYQLANIHSPLKHDEEAYLTLVRKTVHIGHIHTRSSFKRIHAQGSFDRLRQNEEEAKGADLVTYYPGTKPSKVEFLENVNAKSYVTVDLRHAEDYVAVLDAAVKGLRVDSYVRLLLTEELSTVVDIAQIKRRYIDYHITKKIIGQERAALDIEDDDVMASVDFSVESIDQYIEAELAAVEDADVSYLMEFVRRHLVVPEETRDG